MQIIFPRTFIKPQIEFQRESKFLDAYIAKHNNLSGNEKRGNDEENAQREKE